MGDVFMRRVKDEGLDLSGGEDAEKLWSRVFILVGGLL